MKTIFGIIKKHALSTENTHLLKRLKDKSACFEVFKDKTEFIIGSFSPFSNQKKNEVYRLGNLVAISDARIDNKADLYRKLNISASEQKDLNDTQLILRCFQRWNKACFDFLAGDFAIAIFNTESQELVLAIDHIGHRQLYYHDSPDCFIFCSHLKHLIALANMPNVFNDTSIVDYYFKLQNPQQTFHKNIHLLTAASHLTYKPEKTYQITQYWLPAKTGQYQFLNQEDWFACARELICQSIIKRINGDAKIGITLSGGLDSSSIACVLANVLKEKNRPLHTFSSVLPANHHEKDERLYIEHLLKFHENILPTFIEMPDNGTFAGIEQHFYIDEVIPNSFHYVDHAILQVAQQSNIDNLFTGYGGDFWVSWKGSSVIYQLFKSRNYPEAFRLFNASRQYQNHSLLRGLRANILAHIPAYEALKNVLKKEQLISFFRDDFLKEHTHLLQNQKENYTNNTISEVSSGKIGRMLATLRTRNQYYGMESSVPLLDKSLLEFFLDAPPALFIKDGVPRSMLREGMKHILPDCIRLRRDKQAYAPAFDTRLVQDKETMLRLINSPDSAFVFEKYIDKALLLKQLDKLGSSTANTSLIISIIQTINVIEVLKSVKKQNYRLE